MSTVKAINLQHPTSTNTNVVLDSSGRVGVGTSSPSYKLHVEGQIFCGREDSSVEGGQISFGRASDNSQQYYIDVYGGGTTPSMRFIDATAGAVRMNIDGSGRVTKPYTPAFGGETSSFSSTATAGTNHRSGINYGNLFSWSGSQFSVNNGNCFNTTSGRFTAPVAGYYQFNFIGHKDADTAARTIMTFAVNGQETEVAECYGNYQDVGAAVLVYMAANDWAECGVNNGLRVNRVTFSGYLVG